MPPVLTPVRRRADARQLMKHSAQALKRYRYRVMLRASRFTTSTDRFYQIQSVRLAKLTSTKGARSGVRSNERT